MLRIPWTEKRRNVDIMEEIGYRRRLMRKINIRKAKFFGHVMRREGLESLVTTGHFEGKIARGKQRMKILDQTTVFMRTESNLCEHHPDNEGEIRMESHGRQRCKARHIMNE